MKTLPLRARGLSLVELLVTLVILALVLGFVTTSVSSMLHSNARATLVNTYLNAFGFARNQAVTTRTIVGVCPLGSDNQCTDDWNRPISIFLDADRNNSPDDGRVIRSLDAMTGQFETRSRTGGTGSFHFGPDGIVHGMAGSLVVCPKEPSSGHMTYIAVSRGGRARSERDQDGDGLIQLAWGATISCP